jgi:hypothetical protein
MTRSRLHEAEAAPASEGRHLKRKRRPCCRSCRASHSPLNTLAPQSRQETRQPTEPARNKSGASDRPARLAISRSHPGHLRSSVPQRRATAVFVAALRNTPSWAANRADQSQSTAVLRLVRSLLSPSKVLAPRRGQRCANRRNASTRSWPVAKFYAFKSGIQMPNARRLKSGFSSTPFDKEI